MKPQRPTVPADPVVPPGYSETQTHLPADQSQTAGCGPLGQQFEIPNPFAGKFQILSLLGQGGMGQVFKCRDDFTNRIVALKVPLVSGSVNKNLLARFRSEIQAAAGLADEGICRLFEANEFEGRPYFVMEFIDGESLRAIMKRAKRFSVKTASQIVRRLAKSLAHAHHRGVFHRDMKPENVIVESANNRIVITDFGLAVSLGDDRLTQTGTMMGTVWYMSPEQMRGVDKSATAAPGVDIYALGVMLYELLTGSTPYRGNTAAVIITNTLTQPTPTVAEKRPEVPAELVAICAQAMHKDAKQRFQSMEEFAAALKPFCSANPDAFADGESGPTEMLAPVPDRPREVPPLPEPTLVERPQKPQPKQPIPVVRKSASGGGSRWPLVVISLGLLVLAIGAGLLLWRDSEPTPNDLDETTIEQKKALPSEEHNPPPTPAVPAEVEKSFASKTTGMKFVRIVAGTFPMGSSPTEAGRSTDELLHDVTLTTDYFLAIHEVTVGQWKQFVSETGFADSDKWKTPGFEQTDEHPVVRVSWFDAEKFAKWLSGKDLRSYRLPTEAEWEYACRGGRASSAPFGVGRGQSLSAKDANFDGRYPYGRGTKTSESKGTTPVGHYPSNGFGLFDMHGNVAEWCLDRFAPYSSEAAINPTGGPTGLNRSVRGGSWFSAGAGCRTAYRNRSEASSRESATIGFRLASGSSNP